MKVEFWGARAGDEAFGRYFRTVLTAIGYRASVREFAHLGLIGENAADERRPQPQLGLWFWYANSLAPYTFLQALGLVLERHSTSRASAARRTTRAWSRPPAPAARRRPSCGGGSRPRSQRKRRPSPSSTGPPTSLTAERVGNYQAHPLRGPLLEQLWVK